MDGRWKEEEEEEGVKLTNEQKEMRQVRDEEEVRTKIFYL